MREAITQRHALMKERTEMMAKLKDSSPEERQQAMQNWHTQNADRLRAMRPPTSTPPTTPSPLPKQVQ